MLRIIVKNSGLIFIGCCVGAIAIVIFDFYDMIKYSFWEFSLIDLLSLIIYSILAIYVAYYLNNRFSELQMKKNFFLSIVDDIEVIFGEKIGFLKSFMEDNPDEESKRKEVLILLKKIDNKIHILELNNHNFNNKVMCLVNEIRNEYGEIKNILTGDDYFATKSFTTDNISKIIKHTDNINFRLDQIKLIIYD